jgi:predicted GNAT family N-acyltransferase
VRGCCTTQRQVRAQAFYASCGYVPEGETFMDAGIEHIRMTKAL